MSDTKQRKSFGGYIAGLLVFLLCIGGAYLLLLNRQAILDQLSFWQYEPTSEVASFASRTGMSETGTFYFYVSHPALLDATAFNQECDRKEENTAILGCYNGRYIYIYNVPNKDIDGIREVTGAHEMLHAAYDRLSDDERKKVDALLEVEYAKLRKDKEFTERMAFYARTEPGQRDNELHSVIGTEVVTVSSELEAHYKRYFSDRNKVTSLYKKYASVFAGLQSRAAVLSAELTKLGDEIELQSSLYNKDITTFNQDVEAFERKAERGDYTTQAEIDAVRDALLARASQLDASRQAINASVARYNRLRDDLKTIASQSEALNRSIDSSLAPAPSL